MPERPGDGADQPVAAERDGDFAGRGRVAASSRACSRLRVSSTWCSSPSARQRQLDAARARPARPPPADGLTISDSFTSPATRARRSSAIATGAGSVAASASSRGAHAASARSPRRARPRPHPPDRSRAGRRRRASAGPEPVERGPEDLRVGLADDAGAVARSRTRAPPRSRRCRARCPSSVGKRAIPPAAIISAPASTAWVAVAQLAEVRSRRGRRSRRARPRLARSVPLTIRWPASATCRKIAGDPITKRRAPRAALGEHVLDRGADRHDLLERGLQPERPQLAHVVLGGAPRVVGEEDQPTCRRRAARRSPPARRA